MLEEHREMKINNVVWVSAGIDTYGIICITNAVGEKKAYMGRGGGINEDADIRHILDHGGKLHLASIESMFKHFHPDDPDGDWREVIAGIRARFGRR